MALLASPSKAFIPALPLALRRTSAMASTPAIPRYPALLTASHRQSVPTIQFGNVHHSSIRHMTTLRPFPSPTLPLLEPHRRWLLGTTTRTSTVLAAGSVGSGSADGVKDTAVAAIEAAKTALDREIVRASQDDTPGASGGDDVQATVAAARAAARAALNSLQRGGGCGVEAGFGMDEKEAIASLQAVVSPARAAVQAAFAAVAGEDTATPPTPPGKAAREAISTVQAALDRRDSAAAGLSASARDPHAAGADSSSENVGGSAGNSADIGGVATAFGSEGGAREGGFDEEPTREPESALRTRNNPVGAHGPLAHLLWRQVAGPGDTVVDCTAGNGHDSLELAKIVAINDGIGKLFCIDVQERALDATRARLQTELGETAVKRTVFTQGNFRDLPAGLAPMSVQLVAYNLGWLPGGDKSITTELDDTLQSIERAKRLVKSGGMISVMCYRGHAEGLRETEAVMKYAQGATHHLWRVFVHERLNRPGSPVLLTFYRL